MADEQVISQLKERVAFLEGLVMSLVAKNQPSAESTSKSANADPATNARSATAASDKTSEERIAFLEGLVMSLVAKNEPSANPAATQADTNTGNALQPASTVTERTSEGKTLCLMGLPPELRLTILEMVLHPVFADSPYGLTPPLSLPVTIRTSRTRFPAVLHVNHTMRVESTKLYVDQAQKTIAGLEIENKKLFGEYEVLEKEQGFRVACRAMGAKAKMIRSNFRVMKELKPAYTFLEEAPKWRRKSSDGTSMG